jgi:hypothetical protein
MFTVNVPADSCTTWPAGHALTAVWIPALASDAPLPYVEAFTTAQTVVRLGTPPGTPGCPTVVRSAGRICADPSVTDHANPRHVRRTVGFIEV